MSTLISSTRLASSETTVLSISNLLSQKTTPVTISSSSPLIKTNAPIFITQTPAPSAELYSKPHSSTASIGVETLGKVSSVMDSLKPSPSSQTVTMITMPSVSVTPLSLPSSTATVKLSLSDSVIVSGGRNAANNVVTNNSNNGHSSSGNKTASPSSASSVRGPPKQQTSVTSYTTTAKSVLPPTVASTRTRRIRTPRQYDL